MTESAKRWETAEEGELPPSIHSTQEDICYVLSPQQKICHGIQRASDPNPHQYQLSDFDKVEKIGEGTFGQVYRAEYRCPDTGEKKLFALKKLNMVMDESTDMGFPLTALREIKYLSILDHDNIVRIKQVLSSKRKL